MPRKKSTAKPRTAAPEPQAPPDRGPDLLERLLTALERMPGLSIHRSGARVFVSRGGHTLCTVGRERGVTVVDFKPGPERRAAVDRARWVAKHPIPELKKAGFRQARVGTVREAETVLGWILGDPQA